MELDISKAYASAFANITKIPLFNEFDIWKPYDNSHLQDLSLYIVKARGKATLLFNKTYNIVFGCVLLKVDIQHVEILVFKKPSSIKPVDYKKILQELYSQEISSSYDENTAIRKTIANISLLEKACSKIKGCQIFDTLRECRSHQSDLGGTISVIEKTTGRKNFKRVRSKLRL